MKHYLETAARTRIGTRDTCNRSATTEWLLMGITMALVLAVIVLAYGRFAKKTMLDRRRRGGHALLPAPAARRSGCVDELYEALVRKALRLVSSNKFHSMPSEAVWCR